MGRFIKPEDVAGEPVAVDYAPKGARGLAPVERSLLAIDGIEGVGRGRDAINVYVRDDAVRHRLPAFADGKPVVAHVTGEIEFESLRDRA